MSQPTLTGFQLPLYTLTTQTTKTIQPVAADAMSSKSDQTASFACLVQDGFLPQGSKICSLTNAEGIVGKLISGILAMGGDETALVQQGPDIVTASDLGTPASATVRAAAGFGRQANGVTLLAP